jgi:hypothetical protein
VTSKRLKKTIVNQLKIEIEKAKLLPEFGVNYVHMLTLEMVRNSLMGMITTLCLGLQNEQSQYQ